MAKESAAEQVERLKQEANLLKVKFNLLKENCKLSVDEINAIERKAEDLMIR